MRKGGCCDGGSSKVPDGLMRISFFGITGIGLDATKPVGQRFFDPVCPIRNFSGRSACWWMTANASFALKSVPIQ